jgi:hypothetical protein
VLFPVRLRLCLCRNIKHCVAGQFLCNFAIKRNTTEAGDASFYTAKKTLFFWSENKKTVSLTEKRATVIESLENLLLIVFILD